MSEYLLVDSPRALEEARTTLSDATQLYIDTEFEANRDGTRLCLLQVSAGSTIFLVDTIRLGSLEPLRSIFERADWVLHAGMQDVALLRERLALEPGARIFDTQIAWALCSAETNVSLAYLKFMLLGLRDGKSHQADDWTRRPLPSPQLAYAASDIEHLPELVQRLKERAKTLGLDRVDSIYAASREALATPKDPPPPLSLDSFRNAWQLAPKNQAGLRFLIDWYNALSPEERPDAPEPKGLLTIASRMPESRDILLQLKGVPRGFAQRHHKRILEGLADAARTARAEDFVAIDPPPYATFREIRLDAWLTSMRAEVCTALSISPDFALPARLLRRMKSALEALDQDASSSAVRVALEPGCEGFREALLGPSMHAFCEKNPPPL